MKTFIADGNKIYKVKVMFSNSFKRAIVLNESNNKISSNTENKEIKEKQ